MPNQKRNPTRYDPAVPAYLLAPCGCPLTTYGTAHAVTCPRGRQVRTYDPTRNPPKVTAWLDQRDADRREWAHTRRTRALAVVAMVLAFAAIIAGLLA